MTRRNEDLKPTVESDCQLIFDVMKRLRVVFFHIIRILKGNNVGSLERLIRDQIAQIFRFEI